MNPTTKAAVIEAPTEVVDQVCDALIQAWTLGQYYRGHNDRDDQLGAFKAEETHTKFVALLDKTRAALSLLRSEPEPTTEENSVVEPRDKPKAGDVIFGVNKRGDGQWIAWTAVVTDNSQKGLAVTTLSVHSAEKQAHEAANAARASKGTPL